MYIYQLTSDYIHSEAVPYKEFPMDKFIDDLHCLLTQQTHEQLSQLKPLENNSEINQNTNKNKYSSIISRKTEPRIPIIHTNFRLTLIIMLMTTISSDYHTMDSAWHVICIPMSMKKIGNPKSPITKNLKMKNNRKENTYVSLY